LTETDLAEPEKMLLDAGIGAAGDIERAKETSTGFGRFIRSLTGLDRAAVQDMFRYLLSEGKASANQIEFINLVVEHLTEKSATETDLICKRHCHVNWNRS
jgi:type I restriction enzyme, R subunit